MRKRRYSSALRPEINVTPFIDVVLVLLIIFMVTAPLLNVGIPLELPQSRAAQTLDKPDPLILSIKNGPALYLGDEKLTREQLIVRLEEFEDEADTQTIYVRAEGGLTYQYVVGIMGDLSALGFVHVVLVTKLL